MPQIPLAERLSKYRNLFYDRAHWRELQQHAANLNNKLMLQYFREQADKITKTITTAAEKETNSIKAWMQAAGAALERKGAGALTLLVATISTAVQVARAVKHTRNFPSPEFP